MWPRLSPLPSTSCLKASWGASQVILRHSYPLCLYGAGGGRGPLRIPAPLQPAVFSRGEGWGRATAGQLLGTAGAPSFLRKVFSTCVICTDQQGQNFLPRYRHSTSLPCTICYLYMNWYFLRPGSEFPAAERGPPQSPREPPCPPSPP